MAFKINRLPVGLSQLLQIKAGGNTPPILNDELRGVIDLSDFYLANKEQTWTALQNNVNARFTGPTVTVPNNELWLVRGVEARAGLDVINTTGNLAIFANRGQYGGMYLGAQETPTAVSAVLDFWTVTVIFHRPWFFTPGSTIQALLLSLSAGGQVDMSINVTGAILGVE